MNKITRWALWSAVAGAGFWVLAWPLRDAYPWQGRLAFGVGSAIVVFAAQLYFSWQDHNRAGDAPREREVED